jgi:hypothetical protein
VWGDGWCNFSYNYDGGMSSGFTDEECDEIDQGIMALINSGAPFCAGLGITARDAFYNNQFYGGYSPQGYQMYQNMVSTTNSQYTSGWMNPTGEIFVDGSMFGHGKGVTGGLIAHEMEHYNGDDGPNHNTGLANDAQNLCLSVLQP